jgi:NodT family efflux transporter outer membrane factor (OMF) lipoprotein
MSLRKTLLTTVLVPALGLSACAVGPNYVRPAAETPPAFKEAAGWTPARPADGVDRGDWWAMFNDPMLDGFERKVEVSNQNLAAAAAAYDEARALVSQNRAAYFPQVNLTGSATRSSGRGSSGFTTGGTTTGTTTTTGTGTTTTTTGGTGTTVISGSNAPVNEFQVGLGATWEPDIWGKIRRTVENAKGLAQASAADLANARLSAQSELATDYIQLRIADAEKDLLNKTVVAYQRSLTITQNQFKVGTAQRSDVLQAQTQLENAQASLVDLDTQRQQSEHAIAVLMGEPPADLTIAADPNWKPMVPETPIGLPSTLLQRRPDVAAAERQAAAANANIGVQVAGYFPDLTLNGSYGFASEAISALFKSSNSLWSIGADVSQVVFDAGATRARVRGARAQYNQTVAQYRQAVLTAFQQAEDNLVAAHVLQNEEPLRASASQSADQAEQISLNQYKAGTIAYTQVVTTQATALSARQTLLTLQGQRMTTAVALVEALGGGWNGTMKP